MDVQHAQQSTNDGKNPQGEAWTIQKILQWSQSYLEKQGVTDSPRLDGELLLSAALKCERMQLYLRFAEAVTPDIRSVYRDLLKRRALGEPVAYILGYKDFWKHRFLVNPSVLIPRADTERLVETAVNLMDRLRAVPQAPTRPLQVLDIGVGTGCIGLSLALECPDATVTGWDFSEGALAVARANGERLLAPEDRQRVQWFFCDALEKLEAATQTIPNNGEPAASERYDLIVSNPPYIAPHESAALSPSVVAFEPRMALFADHDGLGFYRSMAGGAQSLLWPHGFLAVEVGYTQAPAVQLLFEEHGWTTIEVVKDYSKIDRCVVFAPPGNLQSQELNLLEKAPKELGYVPLGSPNQPGRVDVASGTKPLQVEGVYYEESLLSVDEEKLLANYGTDAVEEP